MSLYKYRPRDWADAIVLAVAGVLIAAGIYFLILMFWNGPIALIPASFALFFGHIPCIMYWTVIVGKIGYNEREAHAKIEEMQRTMMK